MKKTLLILLILILLPSVNAIDIDNNNYNDYFTDEGLINIEDNSILNINEDLYEKTININRPITLTTNNNAKLYNTTINLNSQASGTTISNLNILNDNENYQYGIKLTNTNNNIITDNTISSTYYEISLTSSNYNTIKNNEVTSLPDTNGRTHTNILLTDSNYNLIDDNIVHMGYANGIYISEYSAGTAGDKDTKAGQYNQISNNNLKSYLSNPDSWNYAIQVMDSNNIISNNIIEGAYRGISTGKTNNTITNNQLTNINGDYSIVTATDSTITNNIIKNSNTGIYLSQNTILKDNTIQTNDIAIQIAGDNIRIINNLIESSSNAIQLTETLTPYDNINISKNTINSAIGIAGLVEISKPSNVKITENIIKATENYAIQTYGTNIIVTDNQLESNNYKGNQAVRLIKSIDSINENNTGIIRNTKIITENITTTNQNPTITVKVVDSDNNPVNSGILTVNNLDKEISDSLTSFQLENLEVGVHILDINYTSSVPEYLNSSTKLSITVKAQEVNPLVTPDTPVIPDTPIIPVNNTNIADDPVNTTINTTNTTNTTNITNNTNLTIENSTIVTFFEVNNLTKIFGSDDSFTGRLLAGDNKPISGQHLKLKLIRLSNNQSKTYDVVSDYKGVFNLPINLGAGLYSCELEFDNITLNNKTYIGSTSNASITVVNDLSNKSVTVLSTEKFNEEFNAGKSFTGVLKSSNGSVLAGQHISVKLTRLSSGASKTYDTVTDYTGSFSLAINLARGEYTAFCTYDGISNYQSSSSSNTISIF